MDKWYQCIFSAIGGLIFAWIASYFAYRARDAAAAKAKARAAAALPPVIARPMFYDRALIEAQMPLRCLLIRSTFYVSAYDGKFVVETLQAQLEEVLARGVRVKVLCVDPQTQVPEMLAYIDPGFTRPEIFRDSMVEVTRILESWKLRFPRLFEYKFLPFLPAMGFFITDTHSPLGLVKFEIYTAKPWTPTDSRPHIMVPYSNERWRTYFIQQWENYWNLGRYNQPGAAATLSSSSSGQAPAPSDAT